jgi:hypothetical protein
MLRKLLTREDLPGLLEYALVQLLVGVIVVVVLMMIGG